MNLLIDSLDLFYIITGFLMIGIPKEWLLHVILIPGFAAEIYYIHDYYHWHSVLAICATVLLLIRLTGVSAPVRGKQVQRSSRIPEPPRKGRA